MNTLSSAIERLKFDVRMIDINKKHKTLTASELDAHLSALSDTSENSKKIEFGPEKKKIEEEF